MSAPRAIAQLVVDGIRIFGKATVAMGRQAAKNARHKPEGAPDSGPAGARGSKNQITNQLQMSLDEAHLILNTKKDEPMEKVLAQYERIFAANSPPAPPAEAKPGAAPARPKPKTKGPTHSHYLQSKVYRALERIKAEREMEAPEAAAEAAEGAAAEAAAEGAAKEGAEAPKAEAKEKA